MDGDIARGFLTSRTKSRDTEDLSASMTWTVNLLAPSAMVAGVPEIVPSAPLNPRPDGSAPSTMDHPYGDRPPETLSTALYGIPTKAACRLSLAIFSRRGHGMPLTRVPRQIWP